tara:strand:+ start:167 stop:658 length:492 start_codon:yes stop_codon:yes gene_type:complete
MNNNLNLDKKILSASELVAQIRKWREQKEKIIFTNGCFDILHNGHLEVLFSAAKLGGKLIVALNSDSSVKKLKGKSRPINTEIDRKKFLSYFNFIDSITLFYEETPYNLIKKLKPDYIVKGGDYKKEEVVGYDILKEYGGDVIIFPFIDGFSTTNIINQSKKS